MGLETILYISDQTASSNSVLAALKATGYEVVSIDGSTDAVALLFVMHSVAAVLVDDRAREQTRFDLTGTLRAIRPEVPIVMLCGVQMDRLASLADACVNTGQPLEKMAPAVQRLLSAKRFQVLSRQC
jgi:DNA-binding NtrC family response regulator